MWDGRYFQAVSELCSLCTGPAWKYLGEKKKKHDPLLFGAVEWLVHWFETWILCITLKTPGLSEVLFKYLHQAKLQKKEEQQQMTKRLLEEQKEELNEVTQELAETEHENTLLRRNIERIKEEKDLTV